MTDDARLARIHAMIVERRPDLAGDRSGFAAGTPLSDLGIDSLTMVEMLLTLAAEFGVDLDAVFRDLEPPRTARDLAGIVHVLEEAS